jgi:hypothetical protein
MKGARLLILVPVLLALISLPTAAAPQAGPCAPGTAYDPACDVDHNGTVDIYDIQLTAGHWGQTGTYNIYTAMVPKTGQTTCYDFPGTVIPCAGTGQDGDWQKGVPWPNPRLTDNNNGTVTDNLTGLIWLKDANCFGTRSWATALSDANTLNSGECGLTDGSAEGDWRLPNVRELLSLVDYERFNPALPSVHPFTGVVSNLYWTSTTDAASTPTAWGVSLGIGSLSAAGKSVPYYVWPVRG